MRHWAIVLVALGLTGCVSSGDIELLHREITDVSRQVENLGRQSTGKEDLDQMSRRLAEQSGQVLKSNADIQIELRKLRDEIQSLQAELESTSQRLAALSNELAAAREQGALTQPPATVPGAQSVPAAPAAAPRSNEPTQLYNAAYEDYLRGNFDMAIQGFREFAKRYPSTDLADNALYWVGESYYSKKQFREAIEAFTELLNTYKSSDKAAAALLKKGLAYQESGDRSQAVINLQYVLYEHPGSKEAELARARLQAMGVKVK
ncbi:MAG TPA: tol-pal system protein YbgF [Thermoanaerobaculaceae bacterium]|nr:tol-pal system protein YbgF [Acidobacteriota bacterium]NLH11777.1 tol-pal system protein YbgF [Holophagae bacterium]HPW56888.1 tol-pal system protein YbgF [Thermoanaerobaculaceae bacterium]